MMTSRSKASPAVLQNSFLSELINIFFIVVFYTSKVARKVILSR